MRTSVHAYAGTTSTCTSSNLLITSHQGKQLEDRGGTLGLHADKGSDQKWSITDAGDGKYFITSHQGKQLEDRSGTLGLHVDKGSDQKWSIATSTGVPLCTGMQ